MSAFPPRIHAHRAFEIAKVHIAAPPVRIRLFVMNRVKSVGQLPNDCQRAIYVSQEGRAYVVQCCQSFRHVCQVGCELNIGIFLFRVKKAGKKLSRRSIIQNSSRSGIRL